MGELGVKFNKSISLNYTKIELVSEMPIYLGNISVVKNIPELHKELIEFYSLFQPHVKSIKTMEHVLLILYDMLWLKKFYLYFNYEYWYLPLQYPFIRLSYNNIPLP